MQNSRSGVNIHEITAKSLLHYHSSPKATNWDINIYRGCGHGCVYCFARYSHEWLGDGKNDFFNDIYVKNNCPELLDRELSRSGWKGCPITIGGVTDSYQPIESEYRIMPDLIKVLRRHRNPVVINTKSALILRDLDLLGDLARVTEVRVGTSVITLDENLSAFLEPGAPGGASRLDAMGQLGRAGCRTILLMAPVIPLLTDSIENMKSVLDRAQHNGIEIMMSWHLKLRGGVRRAIDTFFRERHSDLRGTFFRLYSSGKLTEEYRDWHDRIMKKIFSQYQFNLPSPIKTESMSDGFERPIQMQLFE
ncbi:MAG: hypothetical protein CVV64_15725 [Candidatus Wallbacteria bacterium HGW-Wallbacteria-1]|jgi:DNA repair photolyase|uniref:Radical SAM core domain-containing protein n=1 Tax=Candidatus Wallbacteria bacterium HGW-Wallbacteria-1 TaxID=2013854 RepID=A0A2N1PLE1_9BACT|nr:MAG: hypothetical protein CVV64_15725 [Candidatus Wallbacteria bacterium HGW-Wallbacteria-1]